MGGTSCGLSIVGWVLLCTIPSGATRLQRGSKFFGAHTKRIIDHKVVLPLLVQRGSTEVHTENKFTSKSWQSNLLSSCSRVAHDSPSPYIFQSGGNGMFRRASLSPSLAQAPDWTVKLATAFDDGGVLRHANDLPNPDHKSYSISYSLQGWS